MVTAHKDPLAPVMARVIVLGVGKGETIINFDYPARSWGGKRDLSQETRFTSSVECNASQVGEDDVCDGLFEAGACKAGV